MTLRSFDRLRRIDCLKEVWLEITIILIVVILENGCLETGPGQTQATSVSTTTAVASPAPSTSVSNIITNYQNALSVKILFKKSSFYNNDEPGPLYCAGDAKVFYDPLTSRQIPAAPSWVKNISVDITNSNAFNGPSRATSCGLSGQNLPPAVNCAFFDDLQPLDGQNSRSILMGGIGCQNNTNSCSITTATPLSDIWNLNIPGMWTFNSTISNSANSKGVISQAPWSQQALGLQWIPPAPATPGTYPLIWGAGDYDELHNQFYIFGGATPDPNANPVNSTLTFTNRVIKVSFAQDGSVSTVIPPQDTTNQINTNMAYAGWLIQAFSQGNGGGTIASPPPMVGETFTYALRRDPTFKTWCNYNDNAICPQPAALNTSSAVKANEEHDYFLLVGGMPKNGQAIPGANNQIASTSGIFLKDIYLFKPHGFSNDVTNANPTSGDWNLLTNTPGSTSPMSQSVMSIANITATGNAQSPFSIVTSGSSFTKWVGRAYHRTVYDPFMNRFYIYGGLTNATAFNGNPLSAVAGLPIVTSDLWVYDPPALGRRPTEACWTAVTPDNLTLAQGATGIMGNVKTPPAGNQHSVNLNIGINENYLHTPIVFPPGGCLQKMNLTSAPQPRFEHSMAFDRNQKAMLVFGGCNNSGLITDSDKTLTITQISGDPSGNCTPTTTNNPLLQDTWLYIPPVVTEVIPQSQYTATKILTNIFNIDFWLQSLPLYTGNDPGQGLQIAPTTTQAMGVWINLTPSSITATNSPTPRMSASISYDRAHHKFYLFGGYGCQDTSCVSSGTLNDLWEFTPPLISQNCSPNLGTCSSLGSWVNLQPNNPPNSGQPNQSQPFLRRGALMAYARSSFSYGDEFYTITDSSCTGQGPIESSDPSVNKQLVGAIYIDLNRNVLNSNESLLINLRFLPFDNNTRLPDWLDFDQILSTPIDDTDNSSSNDTALIRVQVLSNPLNSASQIQAAVQPRYHEYLTGTPVLADTLMYVAGPTGQLTDQQILIPLPSIPNGNLIKIERVQGSVKFYEMTLTRY